MLILVDIQLEVISVAVSMETLDVESVEVSAEMSEMLMEVSREVFAELSTEMS